MQKLPGSSNYLKWKEKEELGLGGCLTKILKGNKYRKESRDKACF